MILHMQWRWWHLTEEKIRDRDLNSSKNLHAMKKISKVYAIRSQRVNFEIPLIIKIWFLILKMTDLQEVPTRNNFIGLNEMVTKIHPIKRGVITYQSEATLCNFKEVILERQGDSFIIHKYGSLYQINSLQVTTNCKTIKWQSGNH